MSQASGDSICPIMHPVRIAWRWLEKEAQALGGKTAPGITYDQSNFFGETYADKAAI